MSAASCPPFWCSIYSPDVPFGPWPVWGFDLVRVVVFLLGSGGVILTYVALAEQAHGAPWGQQTRWLAGLLFTVSVLGTEIEHFGDYASWRLVVNLIAVTLNLGGLWSFLHHEPAAGMR